ncbi:isochorismatase family protein [Propionivibrio sp.]|uniref:isochorismatase family protein n=1 Tax=Propionivibrio sp. TaxID=2212460 RepID=UPI003BEFBB60
MLLDAAESQLVLVDYQIRLLPAILEGPAVVANAVRLGQLARLMDVPVWGTEQNPSRLGENVPEVRTLCHQTLSKMHFSGVPDGLSEWLRPHAEPVAGNPRTPATNTPERNTVLIAGCEAHVCLLQTALDLLECGFDVWVVTDACSSRTEGNRDAAFDRLASAGAELVTTEMVAFEWLRSCEHIAFKAAQALIK